MKIGILTLPLWNNYGGIIQAYALQKVISNLGHETYLINYHYPVPSTLKIFKNKIVRWIKTYIAFKKNLVIYPDYYQNLAISKLTLDFIDKEINPKTQKLYSFNELEQLNSELDVFIVGSDQVWRPIYTPNVNHYFFDFLHNTKTRIAYAASFGTDNWEYSAQKQSECKKLIKKFKAVSVRENSAIDMCRERFGIEAIQTLDPTMLLNKNEYLQLCNKYQADKINANLFSYILDETKENNEVIETVSDKLGLVSFRVMAKSFDKNFNIQNVDYVFPSVIKWIKAFDDAHFVITDSFHGCVFSIIFNKPFIVIGNKQRGLARFYSLLNQFELTDRLILSIAELNDEVVDRKIDWDKVNAILNKNKNVSLQFLTENLAY